MNTSLNALAAEKCRLEKLIGNYGLFLSGKITDAQRINFTSMYRNTTSSIDKINQRIRTAKAG